MKTERQKLIKANDDLFREIIRIRDNWTCQRTGIKLNKNNADCAHLFSRDYKRIRWDESNACLLRKGIHKNWAHVKYEEFRDWFIQRIGQDEFNRLKLRSRVRGTIYTHELKVIKMGLQMRLKRLKFYHEVCKKKKSLNKKGVSDE